MRAWLSIEPEPHGDMEPMPGVQRMVTVADAGALRRLIDELLTPWGAKLGDLLGDVRYNQTIPIVHAIATYPAETGLMLSIYPCTADGTNVDIDPIEPGGG